MLKKKNHQKHGELSMKGEIEIEAALCREINRKKSVVKLEYSLWHAACILAASFPYISCSLRFGKPNCISANKRSKFIMKTNV